MSDDSRYLLYNGLPNVWTRSTQKIIQALIEVGQSIEDDRRALEAEGAVKIRKIEVDYEQFEVSSALLCLQPSRGDKKIRTKDGV